MTLELPAFPMKRGECPFSPPPEYAGMRADAPVTKARLWDGSTTWLVSRYSDVRALIADPRISSADYPATRPGMAAIRDTVSTPFVRMDPPEHTAHRKMVMRFFTPRRSEEMRPMVQQVVDGCIDEMEAAGAPLDLVQALAVAVPARVICILLGVPYADRDFFQRRSETIFTTGTSPEDTLAALHELIDYMAGLVAAKEKDPGDDILSALIAEQLRPGHLTSEDLVNLALFILTSAYETTANMIALGVLTMLRHPEQLAALREDPSLTPNAVQELMRYLTVADLAVIRAATGDIEVAGEVIPKGDHVILLISSANRDPEMFPEPDVFDIRRPQASKHLGFGHGVHRCLGAPLAEIELEIVFRTLFDRLPGLRLAVPFEQIRFASDQPLNDVRELPVTW